MQTKHVVVVPYDPQWKQDFEVIRDELALTLGPLALTIEHVGSTAVPGLSAKPIIDIDIVIQSPANLEAVIQRLAAIGYSYEGDLGVPDRHAFCYTGKTHLREHHLYVCPQDSAELNRHIQFRNYLRTTPEAVRQYSLIKQEAARRYPEDIERYISYKSPCIELLYARCGLR